MLNSSATAPWKRAQLNVKCTSSGAWVSKDGYVHDEAQVKCTYYYKLERYGKNMESYIYNELRVASEERDM